MPGLSARIAAAVLFSSMTLTACTSGPVAPVVDRPTPVSGATTMAGLHGTVLDPPLPAPSQALDDTDGRLFSIGDRAHTHVTVLFFGYIHCPDVCPATMADLAAARRKLPTTLRQKVTVVFVTEDPKRDRPAVLRTWLDRFDPSFIGLIGGNATSKAMLNQLYLPETQLNPTPEKPVRHRPGAGHEQHSEYGIDHSGAVYAFTAQPQASVIYTGGTTAEEYAADFTRMVQSLG
jgi:protein SCO1/2